MALGTDALDARIAAIARYPFRAKFHLRPPEVRYARAKGEEVIRRHADELIGERLAPARPPNDGRQTPWGGHPVFRAQHATATCCRGCLAKNHRIPAGHELTPNERRFVVDLIVRWIERELAAASAAGAERGGDAGSRAHSTLF